MDTKGLIDRVTAILMRPKTEWPIIAAEPANVGSLYTKYIVILAAIPAVMGFLRSTVIGVNLPFAGTFRVSVGAGITGLVLGYVLALVSVFVMALVVDALAPTFGGEKNRVQALKTVAYAYTASWIASIGQIVPWLSFLILIAGGVYSIYLLYLGLPSTMKCPPDKAAGYTAVSIIIAIILGWVIGLLIAGVTGMGVAMSGGFGHAANISPGAGDVTFDKNSPLGALAEYGKRAEAASKQMEAAQKSGDSKAQADAAGAMMAAALGQTGKVEALAPDRLKPFLPESMSGLKRTEMSVERNGAMGMQVAEAHASYADDAGHSVRLEITDTGAAKGFMALAGWAGAEQDKETDHGYDKMYKNGDRIIQEHWDSRSNNGEYSETVGERFVVKLSGAAASIDDLKAGVHSVNLSGLEALKDEGVKKN